MKDDRYPLFSRMLHWCMACLFLFQIPLGYYMEGAEKPLRFFLYGVHKKIGILLLLLVVLRLINRVASSVPNLDAFPLWQQVLAKFTHSGLYLLMILIPASGWLMSSYAGYPPKFPIVGALLLPVQSSKSIAEFYNLFHVISNYIFLLLLFMHLSGVAFHSYVIKDGLFSRMSLFRFNGS